MAAKRSTRVEALVRDIRRQARRRRAGPGFPVAEETRLATLLDSLAPPEERRRTVPEGRPVAAWLARCGGRTGRWAAGWLEPFEATARSALRRLERRLRARRPPEPAGPATGAEP